MTLAALIEVSAQAHLLLSIAKRRWCVRRLLRLFRRLDGRLDRCLDRLLIVDLLIVDPLIVDLLDLGLDVSQLKREELQELLLLQHCGCSEALRSKSISFFSI